jgi:hypothetical protein
VTLLKAENMIEETSAVLEFVAPLPLDKCVRRLEARHEKMKWFAWDWQHRTLISVHQQDPDTYRFTMKRVQKNSFLPYGSLAMVRGYLRKLDGDHTVVLAEKHVVYFWLVMPLVALIGMIAAMLLVNDPSATPANIRVMGVIAGAFGLGWLAISWWRVGAQMWELVATLKDAVAGDMLSG